MRILFLNPPFIGKYSRTSRSPAVTKGGTIYYPFWLAYAAAVAEKAGHEVRLADAPADGLSMEEVLLSLRSSPPDLAVVDTSTASIYDDARNAALLKSRFPRCYTVLVGTHPSALPEWTLGLAGAVDAVARGEYDYTIRDLAAALAAGAPPAGVAGMSVRADGGIRSTGARPLIRDLDSIPFVSDFYRRHLDIRHYYFAAAGYPMVMIITGRGCPARCFFCVYPQTFHSREYRVRSAESVVEEFAFIRRRMPEVREIGIEDDTFTMDKDRVRRICDLLLSRGVGIRWYCNGRADIDYDLLRLMKRAGCRLITVGFESGRDEILRAIHKGLTRERMLRFARDARRAGILVHGCLMAGNPGETEETMRENYRFATELNCDSMQFYPLFVYPGTEAYVWAKKNGYLATENFREWLDEKGDYRCVINPPGLTAETMVSLCKSFFVRYHFRGRYILMKLRQAVLHPSEGLRTARSAVNFLRFLLMDRVLERLRRRGRPPAAAGGRR